MYNEVGDFMLSKRLEAVASLVEDNRSIIDIGCDHALLSIYIAKNKNPKKVIASDNKEGPLVGAKENIDKYKVNDKVILKLGDGVDPIESDTDTIGIAGMGGLTIVGILKYKRDLYRAVDTIIVSANTDVDFVRKEICKLGYFIEEEILVKDGNITYPIIRFKKGKKHYKKIEYLLGPILINKKEKLFIEYLTKEKETKEKILSVLPKKYILKRLQLRKELKEINKIL